MKTRILNLIDDMISDFLYYDRKEDDRVPRGAIDEAVKDGVVTKEEIVARFAEQLDKGLS